MKENPLFWPQVDIHHVDPDWWDEVMATTARFQDYFSPELDDAADFTIRSIVHVILTRERKDVEWFFDGSMQSDRVLEVHELLHSINESEKQNGLEELIKLINDYTKDQLE